MLANTDDLKDEEGADNGKPNAYRVDDGANTHETHSNSNTKPVTEGQPMGGQRFGKNNTTPSGDDKNNPSRNAGYSNAYFRRTQPAQEHTESNNFKVDEDQTYQEGTADYDGQKNA